MADVISRLKLESGEFDSKIKRAGQELLAYGEHCKKMGLEMGYANKDAKEFAKALGDMKTVSQTARGKLNELTEAFTNLKAMYNQMTDAEKQNTFGKELAASLDKLKTRINEAKENLNSVNAELVNTKQAEDGAKSGLEGLTSALGINVKSLAGWGTALAAGKVALDVAKDAFFASEANVDEWGRTIQSAQSVYEGFLISINNGDISGFLSRMDDIVKAARAAYNELDTLGTMKTIQAPQVSAQQTENERIRSMIQTGRYIAPIDGRRNAVFNGREMQNGDKLTAGQIRALEKQLQNGMQNVVKLVGNEVKQTGKAINAYYDSIAKQNGMSLQEFKKGTSTWEEFSKKMQGYEQYKEWDKQARTEFAKQGGRGNVDFDKSNPFAEFKKWGTFRVDKMGENSYNDLVRLIQQRDQQAGQAYSMQSQAYRTMNRAEGFTVSKLMGNGGKGGKSKQQQAEDKVTAALQDYQQIIDKASLELKSGAVTEADVKKKQLSAQERLYDAYGDAYALYKDPKYKDAQDKAAEEIVKLGGEVKAATEAQEAARKAARELESAQKKLADAQKELANAQASGDLKQIYAAEKKVETAQKAVTQSSTITVKVEGKEALEQLQKLEGVQTVKVNVEEGNVNLPQVPTNDETIKVNVEQGKIDLPEVPTDDKTIKVNVEQGTVELPSVPTDDKTIKVNVEQGTVELPKLPDEQTIKVTYTDSNLQAFIGNLKERIGESEVGSDLYNALTKQLADATMLGNFISEAVKNGIDVADIDPQKLFSKIFGDGQTAGDFIPDGFWEGLGEQYSNATGKKFDVNTNTGEVKEGKDNGEELKKFNEGVGKLTGGLSQVTGGLKAIGIELPQEVDQVLGVINGVSQIISGVGTIISVFGTTAITANTTAVGLNTAAIAGLIAAIEVNTATNIIPFFAGGGIVPAFAQGGLIGRAAGGMMIPGNSMSGDRLRLPVDGGLGMIGVNSGELILNRAQQGNLASQLEGGGIGNLHLDTVISGEDIRLVLNNNGRRTGRGEYVTTRNSRT